MEKCARQGSKKNKKNKGLQVCFFKSLKEAIPTMHCNDCNIKLHSAASLNQHMIHAKCKKYSIYFTLLQCCNPAYLKFAFF